MESRDWIDRCGEALYFDAFRWAHEADPSVKLCSSESHVLSSLTLTKAEAYHNLVYRLKSMGVPISAICVQAVFEGVVDASTVKHRLDVLQELQLPVYVTDLEIRGLDSAKHAYELEKFMRIAYSHDAVAGIFLGELWDDAAGNSKSSGLYAANKQPKPAAKKLTSLWTEEWHTEQKKKMGPATSVLIDGYYGVYDYSISSGEQECFGALELKPSREFDYTPGSTWAVPQGAEGEPQAVNILCKWKGHLHVPVWVTPAGEPHAVLAQCSPAQSDPDERTQCRAAHATQPSPP